MLMLQPNYELFAQKKLYLTGQQNMQTLFFLKKSDKLIICLSGSNNIVLSLTFILYMSSDQTAF